MPIPLGVLAVAGAGAAGGGSYELIESALITTNTASVTFSNLNTYASTYKHLQIRAVMKCAATAGNNILSSRLVFNGDTATNYTQHTLYGFGSGVVSSASTSRTGILVSSSVAQNVTASVFATAIVDILDYSNTSINKTTRALAGGHDGSGTDIRLQSGLWLNTAAITSIAITEFNNNSFVSGTRISLYGLRG